MKAAAACPALVPPIDAWGSTREDDPTAAAPVHHAEGDAPPDDATAVPSFDEIYDRYLVFVWRALRALGIAPPALDDAVQDVFVVVHRRLWTFEGRSKLTTWLLGFTLRVARNYRRRQAPSTDLSEVGERLLDDRPSPFEEVARSEAFQLIEQILDALDEKKRIVFVLMEIEQMTAEEVAGLLGVNVNTVYSRRRFARIEFDRLVALRGGNAR